MVNFSTHSCKFHCCYTVVRLFVYLFNFVVAAALSAFFSDILVLLIWILILFCRTVPPIHNGIAGLCAHPGSFRRIIIHRNNILFILP